MGRLVLLQVDDLKQFRQWESRTPGHPENFLTPGVEVTTGAHRHMYVSVPSRVADIVLGLAVLADTVVVVVWNT